MEQFSIQEFQSTCPLRGTTKGSEGSLVIVNISIHVPLAGHDVAHANGDDGVSAISIHVPLAGHDSESRRKSF